MCSRGCSHTAAMTRTNRARTNAWLWRPAEEPEILPTGDVVIREPQEGWSRALYEAVLAHHFAVRGTYPRTARMHPSTALAVAPAESVAPVWWPIYEVRRHYAPARIVLTDDPPPVLER
jgi:hypothetical protein